MEVIAGKQLRRPPPDFIASSLHLIPFSQGSVIPYFDFMPVSPAHCNFSPIENQQNVLCRCTAPWSLPACQALTPGRQNRFHLSSCLSRVHGSRRHTGRTE